jgi:chemotaxis protein histidine kinase CheA
MMVGLLLYGYCVRVFSSRRLEKATHEDVGFRVLCGGHHPDHSTISTFRKTYLPQLSDLFLQVLRLCQEAGLVKLGHVALDGTKMQGNASKHKAMSYSGMKRKEEELRAEIETLLKNAQAADEAEDREYGEDKREDELSDELQRRETRRQKIREAREKLEAQAARAHAEHKQKLAEKAAREAAVATADDRETAQRKASRSEEKARESASRALEKAEKRVESAAAKAASLSAAAQSRAEKRAASVARKEAEAARADLEKAKKIEASSELDTEDGALPEHRVPFDKHGNPTPKAQLNFTDADSKIMKTGNGYVQGYNCQAAVDEGSQIIVGQALTNQPPDQEHLRPLLDQVLENAGVPEAFTADAGYWSADNAELCELRGVDAYIAPDRRPARAASDGDDNADDTNRRTQMRKKLSTQSAKAIYARRKAVVEPVFGQTKEARGFRRFMLRGIEQNRAEWGLLCTVHNLLKLLGARGAETKAQCPA